MAGYGETLSLTKEDMEKLKEKLEQAMKELPKFKELKDQVQITVTGEGLRVELLESAKGTFLRVAARIRARSVRQYLSGWRRRWQNAKHIL